jgi:hypothetical protein
MELRPTNLILRRREAPSRRMAAGTISLVAVLRDARTQVGFTRLAHLIVLISGKPEIRRAPQDEVDTTEVAQCHA